MLPFSACLLLDLLLPLHTSNTPTQSKPPHKYPRRAGIYLYGELHTVFRHKRSGGTPRASNACPRTRDDPNSPHECTHHRSICPAAMPSAPNSLLPRSPWAPAAEEALFRASPPAIRFHFRLARLACIIPALPALVGCANRRLVFFIHFSTTLHPSLSPQSCNIDRARLISALQPLSAREHPLGTATPPVATSYSNHSAYCRKNGTGILRRRCKSRTCG